MSEDNRFYEALSDRYCHLCYERGHLAANCPVRQALLHLGRMLQNLNMPLNTRIRESRNHSPRGNPRVIRHRQHVDSRRQAEDQFRRGNTRVSGAAHITVNGIQVSNTGRGSRVIGRQSRRRNRTRPGPRNDPRRLSPRPPPPLQAEDPSPQTQATQSSTLGPETDPSTGFNTSIDGDSMGIQMSSMDALDFTRNPEPEPSSSAPFFVTTPADDQQIVFSPCTTDGMFSASDNQDNNEYCGNEGSLI